MDTVQDKTHQLSSTYKAVRLPQSVIDEVNEYRWAARKSSFTQALIELARVGLEVKKQEIPIS
jgi:hypothetical protein